MATAKFFLALVLVAAGCALLIAATTPRDQLTALVLVGRHSSVPSPSSASSLASRSATASRAQESISSFVMASSFAR